MSSAVRAKDVESLGGMVMPTEEVENVVIRFAGDSGDGMQLTGTRFTAEAGLLGNDLRTFPDYPAEIRAPAGTLAGVSAYQINFASTEIHTPGDAPDVLVAMNPAALRVNIDDLKEGGTVIVNTAQFGKRNLQKAGYESNPLEDGSLSAYGVHPIDITGLTTKALEDQGLPQRSVDRCKNFFALGLIFWLYNREIENTIAWISKKFGKKPELVEANVKALKTGYFYGETAEIFEARYEVRRADITPGVYRNINGNSALSLGLVAASVKSGLTLFLGSYPITPASTILHDLAKYKKYGVQTFQAEDELAGVCAAIGASFGGALSVTTTSGPGVALKAEAMGLAVMVELPLLVINVQRGGPSTGLPTKTEQSDLLQAFYCRNGEAPMPIISASTPGDCFYVIYEAARLALKYMTPVMVLTDGYIANGAEPWQIPEPGSLAPITVQRAQAKETYQPYARDPETLAREWAVPGMAGFEHRIGGLEKGHIDGGVSYDPANHELMCRLRAEKVKRIESEIPATEILGEESGDLLLIGWGSTYGAVHSATTELQQRGQKVSSINLRYLNPLPPDLKRIMGNFKHVVVPELNMGQLSMILRAETLIDVKSISKVQGKPFKEGELVHRVLEILAGTDGGPFLIETLENAELGYAQTDPEVSVH